jgi:hypothetical protein
MVKKGFLFVFLMILAAGGVFAQGEATKPHKHEAFDLLVGIGMGFDIGMEKVDYTSYWGDKDSNLDMYYNANFNVNFDFYMSSWFSVSTGFMFGPSIFTYRRFPYIQEITKDGKNVGMYMTIPLSLHINMPYIEWLYLGVGVGFNIPVASFAPFYDKYLIIQPPYEARYFTSLPLDIGVDYAKKENRAGGRFIIRITPQFHPYYFDYTKYDGAYAIATKDKVIMTYGIVWQFYNWKVYGRK